MPFFGELQAHYHAANILAVGAPISSILMHGPEILSWATGILGVMWYIALFIDRRDRIKREKQRETKDIR